MRQMKRLGLLLLGSIMSIGLSASAATLATVNGKAITDEDFQALIAKFPVHQKELVQKDANTKKKIVSDMIDQELMVQEATSQKIESSKEYKDAINVFRKQALVNAIVSKKLAPKVNEKALKDFFQKRKHRYSSDQVHAQHILVATAKEAEAILAEVKKPGVDFQRVAETKSKDPMAKTTRGDVGFFSRNMFDQEFTDAAFGASIGDVVGPVKTTFGFHVIKVVDRKVGKTPEFAEVEQEVRIDFQKDLLKNFVLDLRRKAKIKE